MLRRLLAWSILMSMAAAVGCAMCASPYDECGPVLSDSCGTRYCSDARAGSILSGARLAEAEGMVVTDASPAASPSPSDAAPPVTKPADDSARAANSKTGQGWKPSSTRPGQPPRPSLVP